MNNVEKFRQLFIEFEKETKKKARKENSTLSECITILKNKRYEPYYSQDMFIDFCKEIRNINSHEMNDNYYFITDETVKCLENILYEVKNPYNVYDKATKNICSRKLNDKVLDTMKEMNEKVYTHIPIYDEQNEKLVGIFSENSLFQYVMEDKIIEVDENTIFSDIIDCIDINKSKEIVKFVSKNKLYDEVVNDFIKEFKEGNKLSCVMITNSGKTTEKVMGIITAWDIIGRW